MLCLVACRPSIGLAQSDSLEVVAIREALDRVDADLSGCENQTAELARLLEFTGTFPHRYGVAEIQAFQQQVAALSACLSGSQAAFDEVSKRLPQKPAVPPKNEAERRAAQHRAALEQLREKHDALDHRMETLLTLTHQIATQLDMLKNTLSAPDSTDLVPVPSGSKKKTWL